jgi:hypothetical protein
MLGPKVLHALFCAIATLKFLTNIIARFFETEGIAILTMLLSRYKITIKEEPQFAGETFEEKKARILATKPGLTLTSVPEYTLLFVVF